MPKINCEYYSPENVKADFDRRYRKFVDRINDAQTLDEIDSRRKELAFPRGPGNSFVGCSL